MSETNLEMLEMRAREQRKQIHNSVQELKSNVQARLDPKRNARLYFPQIAAVAAILGLSAGYVVGGIFSD
jgi:tetrahydromethanopterin S-methyltransferase subunit F